MVPKVDEPKEEEIAKYHLMFVEAVIKIYNEHKEENGMKDVLLRIE